MCISLYIVFNGLIMIVIMNICCCDIMNVIIWSPLSLLCGSESAKPIIILILVLYTVEIIIPCPSIVGRSKYLSLFMSLIVVFVCVWNTRSGFISIKNNNCYLFVISWNRNSIKVLSSTLLLILLLYTPGAHYIW